MSIWSSDHEWEDVSVVAFKMYKIWICNCSMNGVGIVVLKEYGNIVSFKVYGFVIAQ